MWTQSLTFNLAQYFKIPYDTWIEIVYVMGKDLHQTYSDVCSMPFYEISMILEKYKDDTEKRNKQQETDNKQFESKMAKQQSAYDPSNIKMPDYSNMQMPNITMPNFG